MQYLHDRVLVRHGPYRDRNYIIRSAPRPAPGPGPASEPAGRVPPETLNHPALAGIAPRDLHALATALEVAFGAHREQAGCTRSGRRRARAIKNGDGCNGRRRIDLAGHVLAWRLREHPHLPVTITGPARRRLHHHQPRHQPDRRADRRQRHPAAGHRRAARHPPAQPDELRSYAAAADITLTIPHTGPKVPKYARRKRIELTIRPATSNLKTDGYIRRPAAHDQRPSLQQCLVHGRMPASGAGRAYHSARAALSERNLQ
jgi:hypothetical protein